MKVLIGVPNVSRKAEAEALWEKLKTAARPFPVAADPDSRVVASEQIGCDIWMPPEAEAMVSLRGSTAKICLSERLFKRPPEVQVAVMLHELVHVRLYIGRLRKNFAASLRIAETENQAWFTNDADALFAERRRRCAIGLLNIVTEIGVDRFMAVQYPWVSPEYWEARCRNLYLDGSLLADEDVTSSLRPYLDFYRLIALELGLEMLPSGPCSQQLMARRDDYARALSASCDEETAGQLGRWKARLFAFDPIPTDPDDDGYDELCERVLALTA